MVNSLLCGYCYTIWVIQISMVSTITQSMLLSSGKLSFINGSSETNTCIPPTTYKKISPNFKPLLIKFYTMHSKTLTFKIWWWLSITIMAKPIHKLWQWINNSHNHMCAHYKAAQLWAKLHTKDIRQYFRKKQTPLQINSTAKNLLWPP